MRKHDRRLHGQETVSPPSAGTVVVLYEPKEEI